MFNHHTAIYTHREEKHLHEERQSINSFNSISTGPFSNILSSNNNKSKLNKNSAKLFPNAAQPLMCTSRQLTLSLQIKLHQNSSKGQNDQDVQEIFLTSRNNECMKAKANTKSDSLKPHLCKALTQTTITAPCSE